MGKKEYTLKELRLKANLSGVEMAKKLSMRPSTYHDKESGRRGFKPQEIVKICEYFHIEVGRVKNFTQPIRKMSNSRRA